MQIREFVGLDPLALSVDMGMSAVSTRAPGCRKTVLHKNIRNVVEGMCANIMDTISPVHLSKWLKQHRGQPADITGFFCVSVWLDAWVSDACDVSAFANSTAARIFLHAASTMPKLILMAIFGEPIVVRSIKAFMDQWLQAEEAISQANLDAFSVFETKDRGPFFFWLLNECASVCLQASARLHSRNPTASGLPNLWLLFFTTLIGMRPKISGTSLPGFTRAWQPQQTRVPWKGGPLRQFPYVLGPATQHTSLRHRMSPCQRRLIETAIGAT